MDESERNLSLKELNQHIIDGLNDLIPILKENNADYRIFGSILTTVALGDWFRELGDVEVLLDQNKKELVLDSLKAVGYSEVKSVDMEKEGHRKLKTATGSFIIGMKKGKTTLSLHFADMNSDGATIRGKFGFSGKFPASALIAETHSLEDQSFQTMSPEAQYLMLKWKMMIDGPESKAAKDLLKLENVIDQEKVKQIVKEKPGIYWGKRPLPMGVIFSFVGMKNRINL